MLSKTNSGRVTIRDVAAEAEVSTSTVSLYTRGDPRVSEKTARCIQAAIDKIGYVPRPHKKRSNQQPLFGLLIENLALLSATDIIYNPIFHAIEAEARKHGYGMLLSVIQKDQIPRMVIEDQVRGLIIFGCSPINDELAVRLTRRGIPLVLVDNYVPGLHVDSIVPDNQGGGYLAFKHLVELGHKRIAIMEGPRKYKTLTDRVCGALRAAEESGLILSPEYQQASLGYPRKGYQEMKQLLSLPAPPTAVYAVSDITAFGALEAIKDAGLRVPDDVSLVGFNDIPEAAHTVPPLTTIHVPASQMGELAMDQLTAVINGESNLPVRAAVCVHLVVRNSTAQYE